MVRATGSLLKWVALQSRDGALAVDVSEERQNPEFREQEKSDAKSNLWISGHNVGAVRRQAGGPRSQWAVVTPLVSATSTRGCRVPGRRGRAGTNKGLVTREETLECTSAGRAMAVNMLSTWKMQVRALHLPLPVGTAIWPMAANHCRAEQHDL